MDAEDAIELKFLNMRQRLPRPRAGHAEVELMARVRILVLHPEHERECGVRAARGEEGPVVPWADAVLALRDAVARATSHAGQQGLRILQEARDEDTQARAEGTAFLVSAWEDAKAPPDTRHILGMLGWYVLLTIVVRGPELNEDLRELDVSA